MNKSIKKIIILIALAFAFINAKAHNPNATSVVISSIKGVWVVQFTISQQGANVALHQFYKNKNLANISVEEYKKLYVKYIKEHCTLTIDGKKIPLASGGIKLGNHQTDIKFLLPNFPEKYQNFELKLNVFEENKEQNIVVKLVDGEKTFRKILNHKNQFTMHLKQTKESIVEYKKNQNKTPNIIYFSLVIFLVIIAMLWWLKIK